MGDRNTRSNKTLHVLRYAAAIFASQKGLHSLVHFLLQALLANKVGRSVAGACRVLVNAMLVSPILLLLGASCTTVCKLNHTG